MYTINLTDDELASLGYIAGRYDYASILLSLLTPVSCTEMGKFKLEEHEAWAIKEAIDNEDGYLPLCGGALAGKITNLVDSIV